jgi:hypothetical protein
MSDTKTGTLTSAWRVTPPGVVRSGGCDENNIGPCTDPVRVNVELDDGKRLQFDDASTDFLIAKPGAQVIVETLDNGEQVVSLAPQPV